MNKGYIYIGQYFHYHGKDLQEMGLTEKKIGKTINLNKREIQLNRTNGTIGYTYIAAFEVDDMNMIETTLHTLLSATRLNAGSKSTEWFEDPDGTLVDSVRTFMNNLNLGKEIDLGLTNDKEENEVIIQATTKFSVEYNGKLYNSNGTQILIDVFNDILKDKFIEDDWIKNHPRALRYEAWENPNRPGAFYTKELNNGLHVVTCISNKRKKNNLESIARELNLDLKVNYEYIKR